MRTFTFGLRRVLVGRLTFFIGSLSVDGVEVHGLAVHFRPLFAVLLHAPVEVQVHFVGIKVGLFFAGAEDRFRAHVFRNQYGVLQFQVGIQLLGCPIEEAFGHGVVATHKLRAEDELHACIDLVLGAQVGIAADTLKETLFLLR